MDILDIVGKIEDEQISAFCKRRNITKSTFESACYAGKNPAISELSRAMVADIDDGGGVSNKFHKKCLMMCLYWREETVFDGEAKADLFSEQLGTEFFVWMVATLFPKAELQQLKTEARRLFVTSFSSLHQIETGKTQNINLICRALEHVLKSNRLPGVPAVALSYDRSAIRKILRENNELVEGGKKTPQIATNNLQQALSNFEALGKMRSYSTFIKENVDTDSGFSENVQYSSTIGSQFYKIFDIIKKTRNKK